MVWSIFPTCEVFGRRWLYVQGVGGWNLCFLGFSVFVCLFFRVSVAQYILVRNLLGLCLGDVGLFIFLFFFLFFGGAIVFFVCVCVFV